MTEESTPEAASFDLRTVASIPERSKRRAASSAVTFGAIVVALWAGLVLPAFYRPAHTVAVCARWYCRLATRAQYATLLEVATAVMLFGGGLLLLQGSVVLLRRRPRTLTVDPGGLSVRYTRTEVDRVSWRDPTLFCILYDYRDAARVHPDQFRELESPFVLRTHAADMTIPPAAFRAILDSANTAGVGVEESRGGHRWPETLAFRLWRPTSP
jgi:hypothetical protein